MNIYRFLEKNKKKRNSFEKYEDFSFFIKNRDILLTIPKFSFLFNSDNDEFEVIRANIVIKSFLNKTFIEEQIRLIVDEIDDSNMIFEIINDKLSDKPYFIYNNTRIYIPFFNIHLNSIYLNESKKILNYPYLNLLEDFSNSLIDFFDIYGAEIYVSSFTSLINVGTNGREIALYNKNTKTIYIVNSQGRLDHKIVLFDKHMKYINEDNLEFRLKSTIEAYFLNSRTKFIQSLFDNQFISDKVYNMVKRKDLRNGK